MSVEAIRVLVFLLIFFLMLAWERLAPRHPTVDSKPRRMAVNLGITALDIFLARLVLGAAAVGMARTAGERGWGLFNHTELADGVEMAAAVVILDLMIYIQHLLAHRVPLFWRFHIVHHSDLDLDVSSGLRFHPVEILASMLYKMTLVALLGASPSAVIVFEAVLNGMALFNHSNVRIPESWDAVLRWALVTPDMHRIHHSIETAELNTNYGFNLSVWDRWLGTYTRQASRPQPEIVIGVSAWRHPAQLTLPRLLLLPFGAPPPANRAP